MNQPESQPPAPGVIEAERRKHPRRTVQVQIEIQREGSDVRMRLQTTNLSRGGCYIQPATPLPVGGLVQTTLWLDGQPIDIRGRIITRHPQFGNGIMFVDFEGQAEPLLNQYLDAITS